MAVNKITTVKYIEEASIKWEYYSKKRTTHNVTNARTSAMDPQTVVLASLCKMCTISWHQKLQDEQECSLLQMQPKCCICKREQSCCELFNMPKPAGILEENSR